MCQDVAKELKGAHIYMFPYFYLNSFLYLSILLSINCTRNFQMLKSLENRSTLICTLPICNFNCVGWPSSLVCEY